MRNRIEEKQEIFIQEFNELEDWFLQYDYLIQLSSQIPEMPPELYKDENLVHGCQSTVWLSVSVSDESVKVFADSDALIIKGLLAVILYLTDEETPSDILSADIDFFNRTSLKIEMSSARAVGIRSVISRLKELISKG